MANNNTKAKNRRIKEQATNLAGIPRSKRGSRAYLSAQAQAHVLGGRSK